MQTVVEGLRDTSVYVAAGAPGKVDTDRARQVIGDRPIVVAILDERPLPKERPLVNPRQELCSDIADVVSTNVVIVFAADDEREYSSAFCTGPEFANPDNPVDANNFDFPLIAVAEIGWKYRVTDEDLTPKIEEYVLAFDAQAAKDYPRGVPTRAVFQPPPPSPDPLQTWQIVLSLGGIVLGCVALFFLLRLLGLGVRRRGATTAREQSRRTALSARLNRLADVVLHPCQANDAAEADQQADLARRYVLALHRFDAATTRADLDEVERELAELELERAT